MFASAKGKQQSRFDRYIVRNSVLLISHITFRDCRVHIFPTTFLEIAVYMGRFSAEPPSHFVFNPNKQVYHSRISAVTFEALSVNTLCSFFRTRMGHPIVCLLGKVSELTKKHSRNEV